MSKRSKKKRVLEMVAETLGYLIPASWGARLMTALVPTINPAGECEHDWQLSQFPMEPCKCSVYYCLNCGAEERIHITGCPHDPDQVDG